MIAEQKRLLPKFGLKSVLVLLLVCSLVLGWFASLMQQAKVEAKFVDELKALSDDQIESFCLYDYQLNQGKGLGKLPPTPIGPKWIRSIFGEHVFSRIRKVEISGPSPYTVKRDGNGHVVGLSPNSLNVEALQKIQQANFSVLPELRAIKLSSIRELEDIGFLGDLVELEEVEIYGGTKNLNSLDVLRKLQHLKKLKVMGTYHMLQDVRSLEELNDLEVVNCDVIRTFCCDRNWQALANKPKLIELKLTHSTEMTRTARRHYGKVKAAHQSKLPGEPTTIDGVELAVLSSANPSNSSFIPSPNLETLVFEDVDPGLEDLQCCRDMPKLKTLEISCSTTLKSLKGIEHCKNLSRLVIHECPNLEDVSGIENLKEIKEISIMESRKEISFPNLSNPKLENLDLIGIHGFKDLQFLKRLGALRTLDVSESGLRSLKGLEHLDSLQRIKLQESCLTEIACGKVDAAITKLDLTGCDWLVDLRGMQNLPFLDSLCLANCVQLKDLDGLENLPELGELTLTNCKRLTTLDGLANVRMLHNVDVSGCSSLSDTKALMDVESLSYLDWRDCPLIEAASVEALKEKLPQLSDFPDLKVPLGVGRKFHGNRQ